MPFGMDSCDFIICSSLPCFFILVPGSVVRMGAVIYYLHAWISSDICVYPFLVCSWGVLGSSEPVFWVITLSCFFLGFSDFDDNDFYKPW